jgi:hypothetical protein
VWLPRRGILETRKFQPTAEQAAALRRALEARSLPLKPDSFDVAMEERYREALLEAFGSEEAPSVPLVPPMTIEAQFTLLNGRLEDSRFHPTYPREYTILDTLRDRIKTAGTNTWIANSGEAATP